VVTIDIRRKPGPNDKPSHICIDSDHHGDQGNDKGLFFVLTLMTPSCSFGVVFRCSGEAVYFTFNPTACWPLKYLARQYRYPALAVHCDRHGGSTRQIFPSGAVNCELVL
jgi:hypothetical protein